MHVEDLEPLADTVPYAERKTAQTSAEGILQWRTCWTSLCTAHRKIDKKYKKDGGTCRASKKDPEVVLDQMETETGEDGKTARKDFVSVSSVKPVRQAIRHKRNVFGKVSLSSGDDELIWRV